jgi:hypothetical protein
MATTTNYNWSTPDDTSLVKDGAAAIRTLGSSIDTTTKALNPSTTLGDIEYRSSTANTNTRLPIGTTGQVLAVVGGVPAWATTADQTPLTTKGDIFTFTTIDARLGVGANGTVLTADSAEATGLKWATPSGGSPFASDISVNSLTVGKGGGSVSTNTALGVNALSSNSTGVSVTAVGYEALKVNTANYQTAFGSNALLANTSGSENVAVGFDSLKTQTTANFNTALGNSAGKVITSSSNTAIGHQALLTATSGTNTAVGKNAGFSLVTGGGVTAVGKECLRSVTGDNNTAIGNEAGYNLTTGTNNIIIGHNAQAASASSSSSVTFGDAGINTIRCQTTTISGLSDARDKKNIEPLEIGLEFINTLKPVTFDWNMRPTIDRDGNEIAGAKIDVPDTGFIAQDLVAAEDAVDFAEYLKLTLRENPEKLEATPGRLIPILVKAIQDLSAKVAALEAAQ